TKIRSVAARSGLRCCVYRDTESPASAGVLVVADFAELHPVRKGPASFLDNLVHAVLPGALSKAVTIEAPAGDSAAVGWLQDDHALTGLELDNLRVVLIGAGARRAAGMPARLGDVGRMRIGGASVPAVALPPLNDLTASPFGKTGAWRSLRALM